MAELLGAFGKAVGSFLELKQVSIDNWCFKLFYKITTSILLLSSVLVTARQFFGEPIQCDAGSRSDGIEGDVLNSYCWMYSTWNVPPNYKGACSAGSEFGGITKEEWNKARTSIVYNSYYQWVPLYLVLLAFLFYLPRMFWLIMEGGLMEFFGKGTTTRFIEDQEEKKETLVNFFSKNIHNKYNVYFWGFITMEALNWLIVLIQFGLTNVFLHYRFSAYGLEVVNYYRLPEEEQQETKNPMCATFPRIASCDYWRWGSGGRQENINAICVLSLNMINDKVFLILWWWFLFLAIVGALRIVYRIIQARSAVVRFHLINLRMNRYFKRSHKIIKIENYLNNCSLGDWFVLYQLSKNLNRPFFMDFLTTLSTKYAHGHLCDAEDPEDGSSGALLGQMDEYLKPSAKLSSCKKSIEDDKGDNFFEMITQPRHKYDEVDGKKKDGSDKGDDDDDDDDDDDEGGDEEGKKGKSKKSKKDGEEDEKGDGIDLPDGDEDVGIFTKRRAAAEQDSGPGNSSKSQQSSKAKAGGGRKK